jgi:mannose-6-phosphate isomerase
MWHILRAAPDARLALGFERSLDRDTVRAAALSGEIEQLLRWYPARPGETFFVPAGTVHAIGAGIALCEIQQHSDVTYRLYDYGRPRELHLDAALAVAHLDCYPGAGAPVDCPYFQTESIVVQNSLTWKSAPRAELLICLEGDGRLGDEAFAPGQVWVVPAHADDLTIRPRDRACFLRTFVP